MPDSTIYVGDALATLKQLPDQHVQTCVTSPPYWGLRDYGVDGQLGLEETPEAYVQKLVRIFREVRRVLRDDGTLWLNLGDSYAGSGPNRQSEAVGAEGKRNGKGVDSRGGVAHYKEKDLCMMPARVAMALQADGWWLRSEIIWYKKNPMPESVQDRPTSAHEKIYLLSKSKHYFYDADAIREPLACPDAADGSRIFGGKQGPRNAKHGDRTNGRSYDSAPSGRNKRNVWQINTKPFPQAHFAVYPPELVEPCILAGTSKKGQCPECGAPWERVVEKVGEKQVRWTKTNAIAQEEGSSRTHRERTHQDVKETSGWQPTCECNAGSPVSQRVIDPFSGAGTTGVVALAKGRDYVGIELNPEYAQMSRERIAGDAPMFNRCEVVEQ